MTISVIIPTYFRYEHLGNLLRQLKTQTRIPDEILVADQTPENDRPTDFYKEFPEVTPIFFKKPSLSAPRNSAAKQAKGNILLFLDDDIVVKNDFVETHLRVLQEENVDVVNGATTRKDKLPEEFPWDVRSLDAVRYFLAAPNCQWKGMMLSISSCNASIKKKLFLEIGGFDVHLPRMVDFELGYRLYKYGAKILHSPEPWAQHLRGEGGSRKNVKAHNRLVASLYIHKKHFPGWITRQYILKYLLRARLLYDPTLPFRAWIACHRAEKLLKKHYAEDNS